jgi:hypothetical protein
MFTKHVFLADEDRTDIPEPVQIFKGSVEQTGSLGPSSKISSNVVERS